MARTHLEGHPILLSLAQLSRNRKIRRDASTAVCHGTNGQILYVHDLRELHRGVGHVQASVGQSKQSRINQIDDRRSVHLISRSRQLSPKVEKRRKCREEILHEAINRIKIDYNKSSKILQ